MADLKFSGATETAPVFTDMIPFARVADATARHTTITGLETLLFDRAIVINESGADVDTRIEASGQANALFVQGSDGAIGLGGVPAAGVVQSYKDIVLDAGAGNSPSLYLVGGTNDDTVRLHLSDDADAGESDLILDLAGDTTEAKISIRNSSGSVQYRLAAIGEAIFNLQGNDADFRVAAVGETHALFVQGSSGYVGMGLEPTTNMAGLSIEAGLLTLKERALPTADTNYGKIWTESDNTLHFQSGAGVEYTIDITPV